MAREQASIKLAIWSGPDFRALTVPAQHLYMVLLTSPSLSYCGVADWRPKRLAALANGWTSEHVEAAAAELAKALFIVIDSDTEEVLIRSFVRNDGLMDRTRMATAMAKAHDQVTSLSLRGVVVHELQRLREDQPKLAGWDSERAVELLATASVDPSAMPSVMPSAMASVEPSTTASAMGSVEASAMPLTMPSAMALPTPSGEASATASGEALGMGSVMDPPTTSYKLQATNNSLSEPVHDEPETTKRKSAKPLPDSWQPTETHRDYATKHGLDIEHQTYQFRNHAKANDRRQASWNGAFSTWLGKAVERQPAAVNGSLPSHTHRDPKTGRAVER